MSKGWLTALADHPLLKGGDPTALPGLATSRPTAVNLAWAVDKELWVAEKMKEERTPDELRQLVLSAAQRIADEDVETR